MHAATAGAENMASKRRPSGGLIAKEFDPDTDSEFSPDAAQMELPDFATEYRRKIQGYLWTSAQKASIGDLMKLTDLEQETKKQSEGKRPKELRVVWINSNEPAA